MAIVVTGTALDAAKDWFSIAPEHRTTIRLAEHIQAAIDQGVQDFLATKWNGEDTDGNANTN